MGSRAMAAHNSFETKRRETTTWVVCEDAFIPAGSDELAERIVSFIAAEGGCWAEHKIVHLNLRPINYAEAWEHWRNNAYQHRIGQVPYEQAIAGALLRGEPLYPNAPSPKERIAALLDRALENARAHA